MRELLQGAFERAVQACADVAGVTLVFLMLLTIVDIVARRAGFFSVRGIVEISTMAVVLIAFLALPNSFILGGHIVVDLATTKLSERANRRIDAVWLGVAAGLLAFVAYEMWAATLKNYQRGAISPDLEIPMVTFWLPATIGISLAPIACFIAMYRNWKSIPGSETQTGHELPVE
jgi:TRAP-type C4-dicarboxylate transport system permease small subunit